MEPPFFIKGRPAAFTALKAVSRFRRICSRYGPDEVDDAVDAAVGVSRVLNEGLHLFVRGRVEREGVAPSLAGKRFYVRFSASAEDELCTVVGQAVGDGGADAAGGPEKSVDRCIVVCRH